MKNQNGSERNITEKKKLQYRREDKFWILIVIYVLVMICFYFVHAKRKQINETTQLQFNTTNIQNIADGTYYGSAKTSFMNIKLEVSVENHKLCRINVLENKNSVKFNPDELIKSMIEENKAIVSVIKGYEIQCVVFFKAVNDALYNAENPVESE